MSNPKKCLNFEECLNYLQPRHSNKIAQCSKLCTYCCSKKWSKARQPIKKNKSFDTARFRRYIFKKVALDIERGIPIACVETGTPILHDDPNLISGKCISHVFAGSRYKKYYYIPDASVWMTPEIHNKWEFGDRRNMKCYDIIMQIRDALLELTEEEIRERTVL